MGKQPEQSGVWREIFCYRERRMVQIYRIESHGRRFYRSLEYTSDARYTLRAMQPSTDHRCQPWPAWGRHEAGHPYACSYKTTASAVITRDWTVDQNLSLGTETFMPARLLYGIVPQVLLEQHDFWQDESDQLRGYPKGEDQPSDHVIVVRIGAGGHVALFGSRFDRVQLADHALAPTRSLVLRLKAARLHRQRSSVVSALEVIESFLRSNQLLEGPFEPSFQMCSSLLALVERMVAPHDETEQSQPCVNVGSQLAALLARLDLTPFHRRRRLHRTAAAIVPAFLDAAGELLTTEAQLADAAARAKAAASMVSAPPPPSAASKPQIASASEVESDEMVLLDLLHAPIDTYLASLATLVARIENLSHALVWARFDEASDLRAPTALTHDDLYVVSLPRLKLTFQARTVDGVVRLFSVDHADLFVTNERSREVTDLLAGIPHSLLLSNSNGELSVLVPSVPPVRPLVRSVPFSTELVLDREDDNWHTKLENPYYVYPVHVSLCFCASTTLASALYLIILRLLNRQYHAVVQLVDTVASDSDLSCVPTPRT